MEGTTLITTLLSIALTLLIVLLIAKPMGIYLAHAFTYQSTNLDKLFGPFENIFYKKSVGLSK
jgi:potassium-transporting ATPase potassium-binding subunit